MSMPGRPFTITGNPQVETAIAQWLAGIVAAVVADLRPAAVLVSGSFGRGEAGAYVSHGRLHLTSDLDLTVVYRGPGASIRAALARPRAQRLEGSLGREAVGSRVDLTTRPALLLNWPAPTLEYFEVLRSVRVLHGVVRLAPAAAVRIDDLPPAEFARLLFKRGVGLLLAWVRLAGAARQLPSDLARNVLTDVDKAVLACGDVWLYRAGQYDHRTRIRAQRLRQLYAARAGPSAHLREACAAAAIRRLAPEPVIDTTQAALFARWRDAVQEWLTASAAFAQWRADARNSPLTDRANWHPLDPVRDTLGALRRTLRRLPDRALLEQVLPLLLQLTVESPGAPPAPLLAQAAYLLRAATSEEGHLGKLVGRFLLAWRQSGPVRRVAREAWQLPASFGAPLPGSPLRQPVRG
jgi:hypothetical protein